MADHPPERGSLMLTVGAALRQSALKYGTKPALVFGAEGRTFRELDQRTDRYAAAIWELGVRPGERVGFLLPNGLAMAEAYFGVAKAGAVGVPINLRWAAAEIAYALADSGVRVVIAASELAPLIAGSGYQPELGVYFTDGDGDTSWERRMEAAPAGPPPVAVVDDDPWVIVYTSGTTGRPKGAIRSHYSNVIIALLMASEFGISPDDTGFCILPMFHVNSMWFVTLSAAIGATCVIYPHRAFHPARVVEAMNAAGATYGMFVPSLLTFLADGVERGQLDPESLRVLLTSSAPLDTTLRDRLLRGFPRVRLFDIYGATEYGAASVIRHRIGGTVGSVGYPALGQEIRILDDARQPVPDGTVGEVYVRGPSLMQGYFNRPAATEAAFTEDGFLTVGDLGYLHEGLLYLVDRKQDMIIVAGENVYPKEVEDVLLRDPAVALAAVVGIPDPRRGERPVAMIVVRPGESFDLRRIEALVREHLADFKRPVAIEVVDELPMGPAGKVVRRLARTDYLARHPLPAES